MTPTTIRIRRTARSVAAGAFVLALAAGCGGAADQGDGSSPADESGTSQEAGDEGGTDSAASDDGGAAEGTTGEDGADDEATDEGAGSDADNGEDTDDTAQGETSQPLPEDADLATEEMPISAERAIEIATETVGGGDLVQIEIDHDDRTWEWELELVLDGTQHELDIDATTCEVTEHETDDDDDRDPVVDVTSPLAYADAIDLALEAEPGRVTSWELDSDDGRVEYQIEIERSSGGDVDVEIDVETREVRIDD